MTALTFALFVLAAHEHPASETPPLTLAEVLRDVDEHGLAIVAARERAAAAHRRADAAGAWSDPFFAVGPDEYAFEDMPMIRYQVSQSVPLPGKLGPKVDGAVAAARVVDADVEVARREARVAAIALFAQLLYVDAARRANDGLGKALDEVVASAEARYVAGGAAAHHEMLLARAERATLERDTLALRRRRGVLLAQLDELRGAPPGSADRVIVDDDSALPVPARFEDALADQPELRAAAVTVDTADARARAADLAALPDLMVQVMAMQSLMPDEPSTVGAMVGVSVPIFYPWKQAPAADAAARDRAAVDAERRQLELRLRAEWAEAQAALRAAEDTLRLYDEQIGPATNAALESSRAAYATQAAPLVELLGVVRAATSVALEREAAVLDVRLARARLAHLLSMPSPVTLAPASPTLFSGSMGAGAMGGMGSGGMGRMGASRRSAIRMGDGMSAPTTTDDGGDAGAMGGM